jgi:hypothetical protein
MVNRKISIRDIDLKDGIKFQLAGAQPQATLAGMIGC